MRARVGSSFRGGRAWLAAGVLVALVLPAPYARAAGVPEVCARDNGSKIPQCPQSCADACNDPTFNKVGSPIEKACDLLYDNAQKPDAADCKAEQPTDVEAALVSAFKHCDGTSQPADGIFPAPKNENGPDCPAGFRGFPVLECRLGQLSKISEHYVTLLDGIDSKGYVHVATQALCNLRREDLEKDYTSVQAARVPMDALRRRFVSESACLTAAINWYGNLADLCAGGADCDQTRQDDIAAIRDQTKQSLDTSGKIQHGLDFSQQAINNMQVVWRRFSLLCPVKQGEK